MSDFKDGPRIKVSREGWKKLREEKLGPCRICGQSAYTGTISLHHLVPRGRTQEGDDIADNLVPLCLSCHTKIEARDRDAGRRLRANLFFEEYSYIIQKKGRDWLDVRYPMGTMDIPKADAVEGELADLATSEKDHVVEISEGHKCPTCNRRVPHPKKDTTPTNRPYSFRIPEDDRSDFKEILDAAAQHVGTFDRPFYQFWTIHFGLVILLQGEKDLAR